MSRKLIKYTLLIVANALAILLVIEIGLRIYTLITPVYDIEMHKYALHLKRPGSVPGLSHEHIPNSSAKLMGVDFHINGLGFRDRDLNLENGNEEYRILVLGCSNTVGWGVEEDSVFTRLLEHGLNKLRKNDLAIRVINAGVGNYNTTMEYVQLEYRLPLIEPDVVIVHYFINDAEIIQHKKPGWLLNNSFLAAWLTNRASYDEFYANYSSIGDYYLSLYQEDAPGWIEARKGLKKIKMLCDESGAALLVALQPDLHDLSIKSSQQSCHNIISTYLQSQNIRYLDLLPAFRESLGESPERAWVDNQDAHPNKLGHQIIYKALNEFMNSNNIPNRAD